MKKIIIVLLILNVLFIPIDIIVGNLWIAPINAIGAVSSWIALISFKRLKISQNKYTNKTDILSEGK